MKVKQKKLSNFLMHWHKIFLLIMLWGIMMDIKEMLFALDKVTPGIASAETLLYGVEVKFYSNEVIVDRQFRTSVRGLRAMGDGASITRGLQQASANGFCVAKAILGDSEDA